MSDVTAGLLESAQDLIRERLGSVCRDHKERLQALLAAWQDEVDRSLDHAEASLAAELEEGYANRIQELSAEAKSELARSFNRSFRRLRSSSDVHEWASTLLEATCDFADGAALFLIKNGALRLQASRNVKGQGELADVSLADAPAFHAAVDTKDTIIAVCSRGEMSQALAAYFGVAERGKFYLFPIVIRERVVALLYADTTEREVQAESLELLATIASTVAESHSWFIPSAQLVSILSPRKHPKGDAWDSLTDAERDMHRRAQRFARVQVASIRLYQSEKVKTARSNGTLYASLKEELDSVRAIYLRDFIADSPSMVDYLHLELVQTLANNEVELLGSDYPGPMV